jgi:protein-S-isoprenylcysteine O-methyltransferase Ste14
MQRMLRRPDRLSPSYARVVARTRTRTRTRGSIYRRVLVLRAVIVGFVFMLFIDTWFSGSVAAIILVGLFFLLFLAGLVLRIYLYARFDQAQRAEPIDPKLMPSLRYLMPKKYPYKPDDISF